MIDGIQAALDECTLTPADDLLAETGRRLEFVLRLDVDDKTLIDRLLRRAHEQHRSDDNPESIAERLAEYHQLTEPVIDYYRGEGVPVFEINGNGSVEQVHAEIMRALEKVRP